MRYTVLLGALMAPSALAYAQYDSASAYAQDDSASAYSQYDIIIGGAGAAGLAAGKTLCDAGITNFVILEANEVAGGRIRHTDFHGATIEDGAMYQYKGAHDPWSKLTKDYNLSTGGFDSSWYIAPARLLKKVDQHYKEWKTARHCAQKLVWEEQAKRDERGNSSLYTYEANFKCPVGQTSNAEGPFPTLRDNLNECGWNVDVHYDDDAGDSIKGAFDDDGFGSHGVAAEMIGSAGYYPMGFGPKPKPHSKGLVTDQRGYRTMLTTSVGSCVMDRVKTGMSVVDINYNNGAGVVVRTENGEEFQANHMIITFSTGVLQNRSWMFDPPLPKWKTDVIAKMPMGQFTKIFAKLRRMPFETSEDARGTIESYFNTYDFGKNLTGVNSRKIWKWRDMDVVGGGFPTGKNIWMGLAYGEEGAAIDAMPKDELLAQVNTMFREVMQNTYSWGEAPDDDDEIFQGLVEDVHTNGWSQDPTAFGAWAVRPAKTLNSDAYVLSYPVVNELWFAGEATSPGEYGYIHSAYWTGVQTANAVMKCMKDGECPQEYKDIPLKDGCSRSPDIDDGSAPWVGSKTSDNIMGQQIAV